MPELPEVETVARDLRPLVVGAPDHGVRVPGCGRCGPRTRRRSRARVVGPHDRRDVAAGQAGRPRPRRRLRDHDPSQDDRPAVRGAGRRRRRTRTSAWCSTFADGRELRFRDIRKFGRVGLDAARRGRGRSRRELGGGDGVHGLRAGAARPGVHAARASATRSGAGGAGSSRSCWTRASSPGVGNIYADEALWAARLHPLRSASSLRPADERRLYRAIRRDPRARRSSGAARRSTTTRRPTATARCRSGSRLPAAGEPCPRCGRPIRRIVIGARSTHFCSWCQRLPAADEGRRGDDPAGDGAARGRCAGHRTGPRWTEIGGGDGSLGTATGSTRRAAGSQAARDGADQARGGDAAGGREAATASTRPTRRSGSPGGPREAR